RDFHVTGVQTCALPIYLNQPEQVLTLLEPVRPALHIGRGRDKVVVGKLKISRMNRNPFVTTALTNDPNHTLFGKELPVQVKEVPGDFFQPHRHDGNLELDPSITALRRQADLRSRPLGLSQGTTNEVANSTDFLHVPVDPIFLFIGTAGN